MAESFAKGSAPWETQTSFKNGEAPWQAESDSIKSYVDTLDAENVQHPEIDFKTRAFLQNFANKPEVKAEYLKSKGFETKPFGDQILVKKPGEPKWKKLAPSGPELQDVTDNIYNIGAGVGTGVASTAAAVAAAPGTLGIGSMPAAMAAGGATSAALEAARQKAGQMMGLPQEVSGTDVAIQGAAGAAGPLLFGTGTTAAKLAASGMAKEAIPAAVESGRSFITRGAEKALPKVGEFMSGVPSNAIKTLATRGNELKNLAEDADANALKQSAHENLKQGLWEAKQAVGKALGESVDAAGNAGKQVDLTNAKNIIDAHINHLETGELKNNPLVQEQVRALKDARNGIFQEVVGMDEAGKQMLAEMASEVSPKKAFELQHLLNEYANIDQVKEGPMSRLKGTPAEKQWANANAGASREINAGLASATEGLSGDLKNQYSQYSKLQKNLNKYFSTPEKTGQTLENLNNKNKSYLRGTMDDLSQMTGGKVNIQSDADLLQARKYFNNPGFTPVSGEGTTSTSRSLGLGALGGAIGYKLGGYPGSAIGYGAGNAIGSPAAVKKYTQGIVGVNRMTMPIQPYANQAAEGTWNTLYQKSKKESEK